MEQLNWSNGEDIFSADTEFAETAARSNLLSFGTVPTPAELRGCIRPIECWYPHPIGLDLVQQVVVVSYTGAQPDINSYELSEINEKLDKCLP